MTKLFVVTTLGALLLATTPSGASDVPTVKNSSPAEATRHLHLEEVWRAGGEDDDLVFGMITAVVEDPQGHVVLLDGQLSLAHVYDQDGNHLRTLFGEGDGPGEVRGPRDLVRLDDGLYGAVQEVPGKVILVDAANRPAGEIGIGGPGVSHGGLCQTFSAFAGGGNLLIAGFVQTMGQAPGTMTQTSFLSAFDRAGAETASYCRVDNDIVFQDFVFDESRHLSSFWWNAAVADDGAAYVAPYLDRYEIHRFAPDGSLERIITRDLEPWPRTAAEKEDFVETVRAIYRDAPFQIGVKPCPNEPAISTMHRGVRVGDDGTLWVLPARGVRGQKPGVLATFDVFDAEGKLMRQTAVHFPGDPAHDAVFLLGGDRAVVVRGFVDAGMAQFTGGAVDLKTADGEPALMEVIGCRVR